MTDTSSFLTIIDRYGIPIALLIVLCFAIYKLIWPLLLKQIDDTRSILEKQLDHAQERLDKSSVEFLKALERRDALMSESFRALNDKLDRSARSWRQGKSEGD